MDGSTDLADLARLEALDTALMTGQAAPLAPGELLGPDGRRLRPSRGPLGPLECLTTAKVAFTMPLTPRTYIVDPIVPTGKATLVVGDSGIGKTPFLFQLGLSVAGGRAFLGMPVKQGPVLYIDWESSEEHANKYLRELVGHLGLDKAKDIPFYVHGTWSPWPNAQQADPLQRVEALVKATKPVLVIFDCLRVLWESAEKDNPSAQAMWKFHRGLQDRYGCATMVVHHLRKPPIDAKTGRETQVKLQIEPREWLRNCAGTGALLNTCESRLGVALYKGRADRNRTIVINGFAKSDGDYDALVAERVDNEHGRPQGYAVNVKALQKELGDEVAGFIEALPQEFLNKEAVKLGASLEMSETKVNGLLVKLRRAQLIIKDENGAYRKL